MQPSIKNKPDPNKLLNWYDYNAREMPWRITPKKRLSGIRPNPYHVWLSEIMLQQKELFDTWLVDMLKIVIFFFDCDAEIENE